MKLSKRQDESNSSLGETPKSQSNDDTTDGDDTAGNDDRVLEVVDMAAKHGFCLNRIWAAASSLPNGIQDLPELFPPHDSQLGDIFSQKRAQIAHHVKGENLHGRCTFDFCEQSQINFTSTSQRHESPYCTEDQHCEPLDGLFPRDVLNDAVGKNELTVWQLNGLGLVKPGQKYMAISHVWSDGTGTGAWDGLKVNKCLFHFLRKLTWEFGCEGIWWDVVCVPGEKRLRKKALDKMHINYEKAEVTFVHDCFLRHLAWKDAETACIAILLSPWFSRGWTALELAKPKGKVKFAFRGDGRPDIKDLDDDILAKNGHHSSSRHKLASDSISRLRNGSVQTIDDLLITLGSRQTSWARDKAIISALLVGLDTETIELQQDIYQAILKNVKGLHHSHLFHNSPTIFNGTSWSPASLFNMPLSSARSQGKILCVGEHGEARGTWKVVQLESISEERYTWKDIHPFVAAKLRSCLKLQQSHVFLIEPGVEEAMRALLVKRLEETDDKLECQFVGSMYFHPPVHVNGPDTQVTIASSQDPKIAARGYHKTDNETKACKGKIKDEINHTLCVEEDGKLPLVHCGSELQQSEIQMNMRASQDKKMSKVATGIQGEGRLSLQETTPSLLEERGKRLLEAAKNNNTDQVSQLLREGANIGFSDDNKRTPMSWAAEHGHMDVAELLLEQYQVDYDCMDNVDQFSSLSAKLNIEKEPKTTVKRIIEDFESLYDSEDNKGRTPLLIALEQGKLDIVLLLLRWYETQYKSESKDRKRRTPLSYAAEHGHEAVVELLLRKPKVTVNSIGNNSHTPLLYASEKGHTEVVKLLLQKGANLNAKDNLNETPLHRASAKGHIEVVKLLLQKGANLNAKDNLHETPLQKASANGHIEVVKLLLQEGAYLDEMPQLFASENGHIEVVKLLLQKGANLDAMGCYGWTQLHRASAHGKIEVVKLLLQVGANVDAMDDWKQTPLHRASAKGHIEVVKLLLQEGANVDAMDDWKQTPLHRASAEGHIEVVKLLLRKRANLNAKDYERRTPLDKALERRHVDVVSLLRKKGTIKT